MHAIAKAHSNVALVKYFGKRDLALNLPAAGSLSLTLSPLETTTQIDFSPELEEDIVQLNDKPAAKGFTLRISKFLDLIRTQSKTEFFASVKTQNNFPTSAGLASSASGFAALALASCHALKLETTTEQLSVLARRGSGSAARSICSGISVWQAGEKPDGTDSFASTILNPNDWDIALVIGISNPGPKKWGSTVAMEHTKKTSPYYDSWIKATQMDLKEAIAAVEIKDFEKLGDITERSAHAMHAATLAARPAIPYWNGTTMDAIHLVAELRQNGVQAYFTCDAGPQPKVLCKTADTPKVVTALMSLNGISKTITGSLGHGARLIL